MSTVVRGVVVVVGLMLVPGAARADMPPEDIGGCRKVGTKCELNGRPGKCQTKTRYQRLPKPGGGTTTREREYVACVPTGPAPAKVEAKAAEEPDAAALPDAEEPPTPVSGPVPTLPAPVENVPVAEPAAPAVEVAAPAPVAEGGACRVAPGAPGLGLSVLLLLRRRRR